MLLQRLWFRSCGREPELVELGCFIGLTFGQQSWIRLLGIDHHQYLAGTSAAMAPGFETSDAAPKTKGTDAYWAAPQRDS
jgi:hypothetical protein